MKYKLPKLMAIAASIALVACGGDSDTNTNTSPAVETRTFESSFIDGVAYKTPTRSGFTGKDCVTVKPGCFDVIPGESVTFTIGNLELPPVVAAAGQTRITVVDVAKALDSNATILSPSAAAIVAYLDALDADKKDVIDGRRVFTVPENLNTSPTAINKLTDLLERSGVENQFLQAEIGKAIRLAGVDIQDNQIDITANTKTDLAKDLNGFVEGLQPNEDLDDLPEGISLVISDLAGLWSVSDDGIVSGLFFGRDGESRLLSTVAGGDPDPERVTTSWNVVNNTLVLGLVGEGALDQTDCKLTSRTSSTLTLRCIDYDTAEIMPVPSEGPYTVTLTSASNLNTLLSNGNGVWNVSFEEFFDETGTFTFRANGTFTDLIRSSDGETDSITGTFSFSDNILSIVAEGENSSCVFGGFKGSDVIFECNRAEEILLTKGAATKLNNSRDRSERF